jgi:hypothetical protein
VVPVVVVVVVPADIFGLLLGVGGRQCRMLPICLTKEAVIVFFSHQDGVLLDMAGELFRKDPLATSVGRMMPVDVGSDGIRRVHP